MKNDKSLSGCIVLERGTSFLAKQIILHMAVLAKQLKVPALKYSHAEFLLWKESEQQLYTIGARGKGTEISKVEDYYKDHEVLILKLKQPLEPGDEDKLWKYFAGVDPSKYQYGNFLAWILYIKTRIWYVKKGDKRNYCYELAARFANEIGRWPKYKPIDRVSIYDLYYNPSYYELK